MIFNRKTTRVSSSVTRFENFCLVLVAAAALVFVGCACIAVTAETIAFVAAKLEARSCK